MSQLSHQIICLQKTCQFSHLPNSCLQCLGQKEEQKEGWNEVVSLFPRLTSLWPLSVAPSHPKITSFSRKTAACDRSSSSQMSLSIIYIMEWILLAIYFLCLCVHIHRHICECVCKPHAHMWRSLPSTLFETGYLVHMVYTRLAGLQAPRGLPVPVSIEEGLGFQTHSRKLIFPWIPEMATWIFMLAHSLYWQSHLPSLLSTCFKF